MGAVVEFVEDVVGGVVEAVGDVVETVVDVVEDVGAAIDDYVIQPILEDPVSAIATVAAASFLGPMAAAYFSTSASIGAGIAAGLANTAAGLAQGEDFDEAIKGGLAAGVGSAASVEFFGPTPEVPSDLGGLDFNLADANLDLGGPNVEIGAPIPEPQITMGELPPLTPEVPSFTPEVPSPVTPSVPSPLQSIADAAGPVVPEPVAPSPLQSLNTPPPEVNIPAPPAPSPLSLPEFSANYDSSFTPDYSLTSGTSASGPGLKLPDFTPDAPTTNYLTGKTDYGLIPPGTTGGPGLQPSSAPNLASMGGGQGLTVDMAGLPQYMENGVPTSFTGANGQIYGNPTPDVTIGQSGVTPTPQAINYGATTNMGTVTPPSILDQLTSGDLTGAAKTAGSGAVDWVKNASPWTLGAAALGATTLLGGGAGGPPSATPPPKGSTQDKNFGKSLDLYNYMRDQNNYGGDLSKYGQVGQPNAAEHQFFQNTKFVPIPIPGQPPTGVKMGGLIQMKHFAQGGQAQGMQDPRRAQMMAAMAQQRPAGQGGPMGMAQGRPPMMQGGPQGMPPQGMQQGRPQMPQRPRDPKTAYYQYGNPPTQAKAMGGLSQVHSMRIGGGADGRSDDVNAVLSDGEYVMDAESVAMLGNGSSKAGAAKLDQMRSNLRKQKGQALSKGKISPNAKSPLSYLRGA